MPEENVERAQPCLHSGVARSKTRSADTCKAEVAARHQRNCRCMGNISKKDYLLQSIVEIISTLASLEDRQRAMPMPVHKYAHVTTHMLFVRFHSFDMHSTQPPLYSLLIHISPVD
jgi:hypothetical protein